MKKSIRNNKSGIIHIQAAGFGSEKIADQKTGFEKSHYLGDGIGDHNDKGSGENVGLTAQKQKPAVFEKFPHVCYYMAAV